MLYNARRERVIKKDYQVKYVAVNQPGQEVKYVPVYRSPSGDEVFEDEATVEGITIVEVPGTEPSRSERERAIAKLSNILIEKPCAKVDYSHLKQALLAMALEPDLKLQLGQRLAESLPPENPDAEFSVRLLVESSLKGAIGPLTQLLAYDASWDHLTCCGDAVHSLALRTLRKFVADDSEFRYEAALAALALLAKWPISDYYKDNMKTWTIELLVGLSYKNCIRSDWAREQLKELVGTQIIHDS